MSEKNLSDWIERQRKRFSYDLEQVKKNPHTLNSLIEEVRIGGMLEVLNRLSHDFL
ncbi:hypothetical protein ACFO26_07000 [Lactococcus nasutitermitis]|uniref:Uncharacterized protein n=1 Tax=Lactococcus nasutitermitis TaxID=1652957 RepID=A0ABV9JH46_9LACT|nr:hypothetical protein [Lactococcus nasutitermitis]